PRSGFVLCSRGERNDRSYAQGSGDSRGNGDIRHRLSPSIEADRRHAIDVPFQLLERLPDSALRVSTRRLENRLRINVLVHASGAARMLPVGRGVSVPGDTGQPRSMGTEREPPAPFTLTRKSTKPEPSALWRLKP